MLKHLRAHDHIVGIIWNLGASLNVPHYRYPLPLLQIQNIILGNIRFRKNMLVACIAKLQKSTMTLTSIATQKLINIEAPRCICSSA
ncbi:hypothetical protein SE17_26515 [Kouleothrix aurantiaca]|uniref:Uncharacterized protein n=1 Tax=Kouleothrix aurantiaca TaxID=186479 RepID=A0A0P9CY89_9CHLR|nr:hypothetical protein SE17_26515 [Kouleothrix aurantiaca]